MGLGLGETQWKSKNLMHLDLDQSKMPKTINGFWSKVIHGPTGYGCLKLKHGEEEGSTRKIVLLCKSDSETPN